MTVYCTGFCDNCKQGCGNGELSAIAMHMGKPLDEPGSNYRKHNLVCDVAQLVREHEEMKEKLEAFVWAASNPGSFSTSGLVEETKTMLSELRKP